MPWSRPFPRPFTLADGRVIATLREAGVLMLALPELHRANGHWVAAGEAIMAAVDSPAPAALDAAATAFERALRAEGLMGFRRERGR